MKPTNGVNTLLIFLGILALSTLFGLGVVAIANDVNSDRIEACERLNGEIVPRGFNCELPNGLIVDPIKWEENE